MQGIDEQGTTPEASLHSRRHEPANGEGEHDEDGEPLRALSRSAHRGGRAQHNGPEAQGGRARAPSTPSARAAAAVRLAYTNDHLGARLDHRVGLVRGGLLHAIKRQANDAPPTAANGDIRVLDCGSARTSS